MKKIATESLREQAIEWAKARKLHLTGKQGHFAQSKKLVEEAQEVADALEKVINGVEPIDELMMEIGDLQVVLTIFCHLAQINQDECFQMALKKIQHRTGKLVDGMFIKDEQPT